MKPPKKTLYELLQLPGSASTDDIHLAHALQLARLQAMRTPHNAADVDFQIQTLNVAHTTLSSPSSRLTYDTRLAQEQRAALQASSSAVQLPGHGLANQASSPAWTQDLPPEAAAILQRANRASAGLPAERAEGPAWLGLMSTAKASAGRVLAALGALVVLSTAANWYLRRPLAEAADGRMPVVRVDPAEERIQLQEYYQQHGVRPANLADMQLMEQERRAREQAERDAARQQEKAEFERRRFEEETRRRAEEVSANLRRAEEEAVNRALAKP